VSYDVGVERTIARAVDDRASRRLPMLNIFNRTESPETMAQRPEMQYWMKTGVAGWVRGMKSRILSDATAGITPELAGRQLALRRRFLKTLADSGAPLLIGDGFAAVVHGARLFAAPRDRRDGGGGNAAVSDR
jgi:hypothetical protein